MHIGIAGAGAGKTTSMTDTIIRLHSETKSHLQVFCITFTNNASNCIRNKLENYYGSLPSNIKISTIHSFLYQEFIKPYYYLLYGKHYERISRAELPQNSAHKAAMIKRLDSQNILHQTAIPQRAKWVIVKKSSDKAADKSNRAIILKNFKSYCGAICIDEAQDIDSDVYEIIKKLHTEGISLILMGDPKQDLSGHYCLNKIIKEYSEFVVYYTQCYRCPQKHLNLSNLIVSEVEKQHSDIVDGNIIVHFSSDIDISDLLYVNNYDLKYISKKQDKYITHEDKFIFQALDALCEEISIPMRANHPLVSEQILMRGSFYYAQKLLENLEKFNNSRKAMNETFKKDWIKDPTSYRRIINLLPDTTVLADTNAILVSSIEQVKGLEGNNCLFILTTDLAAYLFGDKTDDNKCKNKLYVALTRSLRTLTIYITSDVEQKYSKQVIIEFLTRNAITTFPSLSTDSLAIGN